MVCFPTRLSAVMLSMMLLILPYAIEIPLARVICSDSASEKFSIDFNGVAVVIPTLQDAIKNVDDSSFLYSRLITTSSTASQRKQSFSMNDLPRLYFVINIFSKSSLSSTASNSLNSTPSIFESRIFIGARAFFVLMLQPLLSLLLCWKVVLILLGIVLFRFLLLLLQQNL